MVEGKKITKQEADQIFIDHQKAGKPLKKLTACYAGQWYDVRELTEEQLEEFIAFLIGEKPTNTNTLNVDAPLPENGEYCIRCKKRWLGKGKFIGIVCTKCVEELQLEIDAINEKI